jgi:uncharacterized membrane protein
VVSTPAEPRGEPRWPASLAVAVGGAIYLALPDAFTLGPTVLMPIVVAAVLLPLTLISRYRDEGEAQGLRWTAIGLIALLAAVNVVSLGLLIDGLLGGRLFHGTSPTGLPLLRGALIIWVENVITFGLWFWELDRGGPHRRAGSTIGPPDFQFPQMDVAGTSATGWTPTFVDYLYTSFTNATAFSPTDAMPLTRRAKGLMALESFTSLVIIVLVTARAVNILG